MLTGRSSCDGVGMTKTLAFRNASTIASLLGGILIFGLGWFVGLALLWTSPTWRVRDKVLATLVVPGGLPMALIIAAFGVPGTVAARVPGLVAMMQLALIIAPVGVAVSLARHAFGPGRRPGSDSSALAVPLATRR